MRHGGNKSLRGSHFLTSTSMLSLLCTPPSKRHVGHKINEVEFDRAVQKHPWPIVAF